MANQNPISIFLRQMAAHNSSSVAAADALSEYAYRNSSTVQPYAVDVAAYLDSSDVRLRAVSARILDHINTEESFGLLFSGVEQQSAEDLLKEVDIPSIGLDILAEFLLPQLYRMDRDARVLTSTAAFFINVVMGAKEFPVQVRAIAMDRLVQCSGEFGIDCLEQLKFPKAAYDSACDLVSCDVMVRSVDETVAEIALKFLGHISDRIEQTEKTTVSSKSGEERVDFERADVRAIIREYGPYRFANLHPSDFEKLMARVFGDWKFTVQETSYTGDYGADLIVSKEHVITAVQIKRYAASNSVGVGDVNQVIGAMNYYDCTNCMVITTSSFTKSAKNLARKASVVLWDWPILARQINTTFGIRLIAGNE